MLKTTDFQTFLTDPRATRDDREALELAIPIVEAVRQEGVVAVRRFAEQFGERQPGAPLVLPRAALEQALSRIDARDRELLTRVRDRIRAFAAAQAASLRPLEIPIPGGFAGHTILPIQRVACYVPGGRYPLPSTALMTVATAKTAGCPEIVMATPNPSDLMLAAAAIAGADEVLCVGGAHAIGALAFGIDGLRRVDLIAGPGNRFVTAAKRYVFGEVGIDMLAGPSELLILADERADPRRIAADLLAQAEHDPVARPFLASGSTALIDSVNKELERQLADLPTAEVARKSLLNGAAVLCRDEDELIAVCDAIAPEHLEIQTENASDLAQRVQHAGCLFLGEHSAEVFGDYGVGPNHTLPTSGCARYTAGLNVFTFLRTRTWIRQQDSVPEELIDDTARLAELEGLPGHRNAALLRKSSGS